MQYNTGHRVHTIALKLLPALVVQGIIIAVCIPLGKMNEIAIATFLKRAEIFGGSAKRFTTTETTCDDKYRLIQLTSAAFRLGGPLPDGTSKPDVSDSAAFSLLFVTLPSLSCRGGFASLEAIGTGLLLVVRCFLCRGLTSKSLGVSFDGVVTLPCLEESFDATFPGLLDSLGEVVVFPSLLVSLGEGKPSPSLLASFGEVTVFPCLDDSLEGVVTLPFLDDSLEGVVTLPCFDDSFGEVRVPCLGDSLEGVVTLLCLDDSLDEVMTCPCFAIWSFDEVATLPCLLNSLDDDEVVRFPCFLDSLLRPPCRVTAISSLLESLFSRPGEVA